MKYLVYVDKNMILHKFHSTPLLYIRKFQNRETFYNGLMMFLFFKCFFFVIQIALQFAVVVSKIARYDYPTKWKDLIPWIVNAISTADFHSPSLQHNTVLLTFRYVVKELSSKRLPNDKKAFRQTCLDCYPCIMSKWHQFHDISIKLLSAEHVDISIMNLCFQRLRHVLKIIRIISLSLDDEKSEQVFTNTLRALISFCDLSKSMVTKNDDSRQFYHKVLIEHTKILLHAFEFQSTRILKVIPDILTVCRQCVLTQSRHILFPDKFIINCMNQIKYILQDSPDISLPEDQLKELLR